MSLTREDCRRYLESLDMEEALVRRGLEAVEVIQRLVPLDTEHIFVSEERDEQGRRRFGSMWLLGPKLISEAYRFTTGSEFDVSDVEVGITRIVVDRSCFDFEAISEDSRLEVTVNFGPNVGPLAGVFKASGRNCLALREIMDRYLVPRLTP